jgi:hypothetical protein
MRIVTRGDSPTDVPVVVSDRDYDTEPEEDEYMITIKILEGW